MAKKRKEKKQQLSPRILEAQKKKEFKRKLLYVARASGAEEAYRLIPAAEIDHMYLMRFRSIRIIPVSNDIPAYLIKKVKQFLNDYLNHSKVTIIERGLEISLKDYLSVARTLVYYLRDDSSEKCPEHVKQGFNKLLDVAENEDIPEEIIAQIAAVMGLYLTRLDRKIYWFEHKIQHDYVNLFDALVLHSETLDPVKVSIKRVPRTIYRVGWGFPSKGILWADENGANQQLNQAFGLSSLKVYIQSHALYRLQERVDCVDISILHFHIYTSLENPVVHCAGTQNLIEFRLYQKKIGYLACDIKRDKLIIRTFLFLTMDGTPEGENLRNTLGLQAVDKKYLQIDKLHPFIASDIKDHPELKAQFIKAGCTDLFRLEEENLEAKVALKKASTIQAYINIPESMMQEALSLQEKVLL